MADVKISALPAATTPLAGTEVLPIVQSSTTKKVAISDVTAGRAISASSLTLTTPLAVGSGGTGTSTAFTAGSVVFAGASGTYSQDNANFFWDDTNNRLGIGTASPATLLDIRQTSATFRIGGDANDTGTIQFFNTTNSSINATISGNLEGGNTGGDIRFATKYVTGSLTEKMRLDGNGRLRINTTAAITSSAEYLSVNGMGTFSQNSSTAAAITVQNTNATASTYIPFISLNDGGGNRAQLGTYSDTAGFYLNGQFGINFNTGGTNRAFLDASGNLLVGTTTANGLLTVAGVARGGIAHRAGTYTAGSTTPSVAGVTFMYIFNSSPTSITNFTGGVEGQIIYLNFADANTTITRNNSYLAGGVNFTSTANDMLALINYAGFWFEVCRSVNA